MTLSTSLRDGTGAGARAGGAALLARINPLIIAILALYVAIAVVNPRFLELSNQMNILRQAAVFLVLAVGMTFVISSKGIDLSVGSNLGVCACTMAWLVDSGAPVPIGIGAGILLGTVIGMLNGLMISALRVNPLIVTLGMLVTLRGAVHLFMQGNAIVRLPESWVFLGQGFIGPVPMPAIISLAMAAIGYWLLVHTRFGRRTIAVGSNEDACRLMGIPVDRHKIAVYGFQGLCVGVAAALVVGRLNSASPDIGLLYELHIIAAVVLGGTALYGGIGTMAGSVLGVLTIGVVENGMVLIGADFHMQRVLVGLLLIAAVAYQEHRRTRMDRIALAADGEETASPKAAPPG